ncbi:imm11 family protein [Cognatiyoonia sp. IB215182]|uniref:imm11 family protein n=1 Tax=Cognatiyoonia sp. IB215182 TaxID=3097353 RepID=UPI002A11822E|nr:DUF1629 domain-containing protein [Cognatiyoonia sp. IB215182]MDX8355629.1 hypothetical protein [Cognatiyoonia sp. IB215182]
MTKKRTDTLNFYIIKLDHEDSLSLTYRFSPGKVAPSPWPDNVWLPSRDMQFTVDHRFTEETKTELQKLWLLINPEHCEFADVIGQFGKFLDYPPAVNEHMRRALEKFDGECFDFAETGPIYDSRHDRKISSDRYWFVSVRRWIDGWDKENSGLQIRTRRDGTSYGTIYPPYTLNLRAINGAHLWRDASSRDVLCSDVFKKMVETEGLTGLYFQKILDS